MRRRSQRSHDTRSTAALARLAVLAAGPVVNSDVELAKAVKSHNRRANWNFCPICYHVYFTHDGPCPAGRTKRGHQSHITIKGVVFVTCPQLVMEVLSQHNFSPPRIDEIMRRLLDDNADLLTAIPNDMHKFLKLNQLPHIKAAIVAGKFAEAAVRSHCQVPLPVGILATEYIPSAASGSGRKSWWGDTIEIAKQVLQGILPMRASLPKGGKKVVVYVYNEKTTSRLNSL
jgi:hypothetical protein